jgi:hypothetical protein
VKQALSQLAASQRRRTRAAAQTGPAATVRGRPRTHAGPALDRNSLCLRATLLFARWQRCGHLGELVVIDVAVANVHASGAAREVQGGKGHEIVGSAGLRVAVSGLI